jgi:hypothetical protein
VVAAVAVLLDLLTKALLLVAEVLAVMAVRVIPALQLTQQLLTA